MTALPNKPALFNDAPARTRPRYAAAWSPDERAFADRMIAHWNACFAGKGRAYGTHRNRFVAIQLYRFLHRDQAGQHDPLTEGDVEIAIQAYATDPVNVKLARWKSFGDWFRDCPDAVAKQLARIGKSHGGKCIASGTSDAAARTNAEHILRSSMFGQILEAATSATKTIREYVAELEQFTRRHRRVGEQMIYARCLAILDTAAALPPDRKAVLVEKACRLAEALKGRRIDRATEQNVVVAFACALLDKYGERLFMDQGEKQ